MGETTDIFDQCAQLLFTTSNDVDKMTVPKKRPNIFSFIKEDRKLRKTGEKPPPINFQHPQVQEFMNSQTICNKPFSFSLPTPSPVRPQMTPFPFVDSVFSGGAGLLLNSPTLFSPFNVPEIPTPSFPNDDDLVKMKGPSRLIGFLVTIAMNDRANRVLSWTGNDLEFILKKRELVARMWGNRKHNTKDMDYLKLSRAIREKYEKRNDNGDVIKVGKLKKGTKIYSYVFTEHSYDDLEKYTNKTISEIKEYAKAVGRLFTENETTSNSSNEENL